MRPCHPTAWTSTSRPSGAASTPVLTAARPARLTISPTGSNKLDRHRMDDIADCTVFIVTVPTPIDDYKTPDLTPLVKASESVGKVLKSGDIVIFESTVYPGATEEVCVPVLERVSGLKFNEDFYAGYSPERINPGDKEHRVTTIMKVTSGSTPAIAEEVDALYADIITAGTHKASSIKVAEAAKVIENTQRDLNIALMNELAMIFAKLGIDTHEVLAAAGTKWNFLPFKPGLVGGHCIGVDPYYLTHKAQAIGYHSEIILAGRRTNDGMGPYVASELVKAMIKAGHTIANARVLVMGFTFKENCPDLRNTRVIDVVKELQDFGCQVDVTDCWADSAEAEHEYGIRLIDKPEAAVYDGVLLAVPHREYAALSAADLRGYLNAGGVLFDMKGTLPLGDADLRL
ncbi:MAG: nucleotide sugar dehydrogenase [Marinobacter vinifirmus]|uniref:Nucleotide sugar dehydrogenase n=2 Tax=Marinobacter vinifirmus TaxID=355591 RepID=A0A558B351_9GAMM|nr:MAG: nucleotide sugar dehydrogenase [Marinobacter vinifirmus]